MTNEEFLQKYQNYYASLKNFSINNNILSLYNYKITLNHLNLAQFIYSNLYSLNEIELFQTIYVLELFYKNELTNSEISFIENFIHKYLELNDQLLANAINDEGRINALGLPVYTSYKEEFATSPASLIIQNILNKHTNLVDAGKSKGPKLVLSNPNAFQIEEEVDPYASLEKAGFTTILLIAGGVIATCLYIALFIFKH